MDNKIKHLDINTGPIYRRWSIGYFAIWWGGYAKGIDMSPHVRMWGIAVGLWFIGLTHADRSKAKKN